MHAILLCPGCISERTVGNKIRQKTDIILEVNIVSRKARVASVNIAGWAGGLSEPLSGDFSGQSPLRKFFGPKEHLDWLKIDLNAAEIISLQYYKHTKN